MSWFSNARLVISARPALRLFHWLLPFYFYLLNILPATAIIVKYLLLIAKIVFSYGKATRRTALLVAIQAN